MCGTHSVLFYVMGARVSQFIANLPDHTFSRVICANNLHWRRPAPCVFAVRDVLE